MNVRLPSRLPFRRDQCLATICKRLFVGRNRAFWLISFRLLGFLVTPWPPFRHTSLRSSVASCRVRDRATLTRRLLQECRWSLQSESKNEAYETQQRAPAASAPTARTLDEPTRDGEPCPALLRRTREGGLCQIHLRPSFMDGDRDYGSRAVSLGRLGCCPRTRHRFRLRQHDWRCTRARAGNGRFVLVPICGR